jgi:hypothetical protein
MLSEAAMAEFFARPLPGSALRRARWEERGIGTNERKFESGELYDYLCSFYDVGALSVRAKLSRLTSKEDWHGSLPHRFVIADLVGAQIWRTSPRHAGAAKGVLRCWPIGRSSLISS